MKKILLGLLVGFSSCVAENSDLGQEIMEVSMEIKEVELDGAESRLAYETSTKQYLWEANDTLGVFPDAGGQVEFPINSDNVGTTYAKFDGGGWALRSNHTYSAYYPFNFYNRNAKAIPVSYMGQVQDGNNSGAHMGDYLFLASAPMKAVDGALDFSLGHLANITELALTMPVPATYTSLSVYTDSEIFPVNVTYNLHSSDLKQTNVKYANHLSLGLKNITTTSANQVVTVWIVFPVVADTSKALKVVVTDANGRLYAADVCTTAGGRATVYFNRNKKRTLKASPVLTDGSISTVEGWINNASGFDWN